MKNMERCELRQLGDLLYNELGCHSCYEPGLNDRQWNFSFACSIIDGAEIISLSRKFAEDTFENMDNDIHRYYTLCMDLSL
jgi:hypothetical protein